MVSITVPSAALTAASMTVEPSLGSKRKYTDATPEDEALSSSQGKRQKVAFDPDVEIRVLEDWNEKGIELVREEVRRGIEKHLAGDNAAYDQLKQLFTAKPFEEDAPSTRLLQKYLHALTGHASWLNKNCSGLVHAVLDCQWLLRDESFVQSYIRFLGGLLSAHGGYTGLVLRMVVQSFVSRRCLGDPPMIHAKNNVVPPQSLRAPSDAPVRRTQAEARVHSCLKYLLQLIPSASGALPSILSSSFPFATDSTKAHVDYVRNLLKLTEYAPALKGAILALVTDRLVKIDVQIQVDMEDLEEDTEEELVRKVLERRDQGPDDAEEEDPDASDNESVSSADSDGPDDERIKDLKQAVVTMDSMLDVLFGYYHPIFTSGMILDVRDTFEHLLAQFSNTILPTYRSRHTQFLLFHFGQASSFLMERFTSVCLDLSFDKTRPHILRLAAASYLASFIARGAHVPPPLVRQIFDLLLEYLEDMRLTYERTCTGPDLRRYGGYYAIAQALLYIFCFRWRDLIRNADEYADEDDESLLDGSRELVWGHRTKEILTRNVYSKLNPLKVCSPAIVAQFAKIAHHLHFMYIFSLLETNKRVRLSRAVGSGGAAYGGMPERETALSGRSGEASLQLDAYFPFDPYHLPRSKRWLEGDYNEWKALPGLEEKGVESSEEESSEDEIEDGEVDGDVATESSG
ncbi:hypothetical protein W97_03435 [Coniosporium apollinis CBS 100218]|uniref:RNA polymerase I-specific transcription initiation factor RRN3 n=1 Tax=Coniosporium apollinis (strain CBS 100218) TaxID=1168221 RepID=R7YQK9_CONA1|nr:uncharacterized protein W97_03435 [Coniosporium apollinis CBS 100218]EON64205.1 hypothetical protein W97_03435 [Coniosporium apollinis CBS 100218]